MRLLVGCLVSFERRCDELGEVCFAREVEELAFALLVQPGCGHGG